MTYAVGWALKANYLSARVRNAVNHSWVFHTQGTNSHFALTVEKDGQPFHDFTTLPQEVYTDSTVLIRVNNSEALDYEKEKQIIFQVQ